MPRYVAFLRGINVSGQKLVKMEALKKYFEIPGIKNVVTYIQSGNVVFDASLSSGKLSDKIEKLLSTQLGYQVPVVLRTIAEMESVIDRNPFPISELPDGAKLYVYFLSGIPESSLIDSLNSYLGAGETFKVVGQELFFVSQAYGNTKLTISVIERKLGVIATARNWATVNKVIGL